MNDPQTLNRRQFLRTTGQAVTTLAAASTFAPAILSAESTAKTIGVGCIGLGILNLFLEFRSDKTIRSIPYC
jgi:hypothetical protein